METVAEWKEELRRRLVLGRFSLALVHIEEFYGGIGMDVLDGV